LLRRQMNYLTAVLHGITVFTYLQQI